MMCLLLKQSPTWQQVQRTGQRSRASKKSTQNYKESACQDHYSPDDVNELSFIYVY